MHWITGLAVVLIGFFACSKGSKQNEAGHQEMNAHGVSADWKFTLPKGDPSEG
jgi:hypothetical protein